MLNTSRFSRYVSTVADLRLRPYARVAVLQERPSSLSSARCSPSTCPKASPTAGCSRSCLARRIVSVWSNRCTMLRESMAGDRPTPSRPALCASRRIRAPRAPPFPVGAHQLATAHPAPAQTIALGRRSVCVRTCDGYFFPVAALNHNSEISSHQASCDALCPEAETKLFVMPAGSGNIDEAAAARGGELYSQLVARIKASTRRPPLAVAIRPPAIRSTPAPSSRPDA